MRCDRSITTLPTLTHWAAFSAKRGGATIQMPSFGPIGTPLLWKHRLRAQRPANGPSELDSERGTAHTALPHQRLAAVLWTYPIHWVCRRPNLDRFVILKSRDNLTALSCVRRLRVELLEVEKKDLDLVEVLDGPDGLERRLHDRRDILTEAEAQPGATAETITAALLDELREIRSSGPSASLPSTGDNAPTPLDESRLVAILTGSDNAAFRKITMALSGLDLSTPSGQRDALALGYDGQCAITAQVLFSTAENGDLTVVRRHSTLSQLNELRQHRTAYFNWHLRVGKDMAIADRMERYSIAPMLDGGDRTVLEGWLHLDLDTTDFIKAPHGGMERLQHQDGRSVPVVHDPADYFCRPSVTELTQSGIATIDESGEMHMDTVASDAGSTTPLSSAAVPPAPDPSTLPYCNCHRRCFNRIWPQDRSPLCDFCYDGCDDCECAGEALGPQGQPCCVRPLEAATVCGECTGEVTPVTRTLGQMAVATPAGFAPRCSAPGCEAGSQLLADQLGHLRCSLAQAQAGQILQPKGAHERGLVPSLRDSSGEGGPIEQPSRRAAGPAAAEPAAISAVLAVAHDPADHFCQPSVTELTQSGIATIDESGGRHVDTVASDAGSTTPLSSAAVPPAPDPSTLPYCNCHRRCFNRIWPQDRSPLCDFCYDGCDDCECAGEALGPQGQPCCVRPLEAATVCGECIGEVTPVTRTLGQTPAELDRRVHILREALSLWQLRHERRWGGILDHAGKAGTRSDPNRTRGEPTNPAMPTPPAPSLPASPPASETDDGEDVEDIEEVEVELEFEEENLVLEVVVDAWAPCTPTSPPAPGLSTMASNTAVASSSASTPRSAGGTLGVRACASLDWAGSGPAPRGLEVIYLAAGTTRLITARDPELDGDDWGGTYNVHVSPPEAETGWCSDYEVRITSERRHPRGQDAPTLLISWLSAWGRPLSSGSYEPAITTIEASARNTFGVETQRLSHGEIIAYGTPNGCWSGSTLLTPHLATTRLYWAFRLNVCSEPPLVPGPPGWPRRPPQSTPGNSEPGRRLQTSHLLFEVSSSTAEQVEWARRFIASPAPAGETTAGGGAQAGAVAYAAAATAAATEHKHGAPRWPSPPSPPTSPPDLQPSRSPPRSSRSPSSTTFSAATSLQATSALTAGR